MNAILKLKTLDTKIKTKVIKIDYADVQKLKENFDTFITKNKEGKIIGSITADTRTNSIIIQAIERDIRKIVPLVQALDKPTPQILIEANIVEANRDTAREK